MWHAILVFIISISLFIITQYIRIKKEYDLEELHKEKEIKEQFNTENSLSLESKLLKHHNITINFKNANVARELILNKSLYIQNMNQPNILARGCNSKNDLYNKYLHAFVDISNNERLIIQKFILDLLNKIKPRNIYYYNYMCYWINKIAIAKGKTFLEDGMPHTLENTIIMDTEWFVNPRQTTFIHELTHVHQRIIPFEFEDLYKELNYIEYTPGVENIKGMSAIIELNRNNPDGLSNNWLWYDKSNSTYWWTGAIFANITPTSLTDVRNVALKLEYEKPELESTVYNTLSNLSVINSNTIYVSNTDKHTTHTNQSNNIMYNTFYYLQQQPTLLKSLTNFNLFFGDNPNNYHPNEMAAKFSEWYFENVLNMINPEYEKYNGFTIFKKYFDNLIKTFYKK